MKVEEILKLKDAGFDNDTIIRFAGAVQVLDAEESAENAPEKPQEEAKPIKPVQEIPEWVSGLSAQINALTKTIQASNVRSVQDNSITTTKSAVDVMAEVLNKGGK